MKVYTDCIANKDLLIKVLAVVSSIIALTVSAKIKVPLWPVAITWQTMIVLMLPWLIGRKLALITVVSYLQAGLLGAPVFAGEFAGPAYFLGPTGGYLLGFLAATSFICYAQSRVKPNWINIGALVFSGHAIILALGCIWLSFGLPKMGLSEAFVVGVMPFILGDILKTIIATFVLSSK